MQPTSKAAIEGLPRSVLEAIGAQNEVPVGQHIDSGWDKAVKETLELVQTKISERLAHSRENWNEGQPLNSLQPEVLAEVFRYSLPWDSDPEYGVGLDEPEIRQFDALMTLALVCRKWFRLIMGTPALWSYISIHESEHRIQLALQRSQSHPIDISCPVVGEIPDELDEAIVGFAQSINAHASRFRSVNIRIPQYILESFWAGLQAVSPLLERTTFIIDPSSLGELPPLLSPIDIFAGSTGSLKSIDIRHVPRLRWPSSFLNPLETIHLVGLGEGSPTLRQIVSIIDLSRNTLKNLLIAHCLIVDDLPPDGTPPISLPAARRLHLWLSPRVTERIFRHIHRIPMCSCVVLQATITDASEAGIVKASFNHLLPDIHRILSATPLAVPKEHDSSLFLDYFPSRFKAFYWESGLTMDITGENLALQPFQDTLDIVRSGQDSGFHTPVRLRVETSAPIAERTFWEGLKPFYGIRRIDVFQTYVVKEKAVRNITSFLGHPASEVLPNLESLGIYMGYIPLDCLEMMLRRRYMDSPQSQDDAPGSRMMSLGLQCDIVDSGAAARLRGIMGPNKLEITVYEPETGEWIELDVEKSLE